MTGPRLDPRIYPGNTHAERKASKLKCDMEMLKKMGGGLFELSDDEIDKRGAAVANSTPKKRLYPPRERLKVARAKAKNDPAAASQTPGSPTKPSGRGLNLNGAPPRQR
jgi:hypothetical protein